jgi:hypothetical protein
MESVTYVASTFCYLCVRAGPGWLGWETGFEPATFGATVRRSTS